MASSCVVALDDADRQLRRAKRQLRLPVIGADKKLLRTLHHGGYERIRQAILGNLTEGASKVRAGTAGGAHRLGLVRPPCRLED
jgi:hypothetical protein